jgi:hypothetical protein
MLSRAWKAIALTFIPATIVESDVQPSLLNAYYLL